RAAAGQRPGPLRLLRRPALRRRTLRRTVPPRRPAQPAGRGVAVGPPAVRASLPSAGAPAEAATPRRPGLPPAPLLRRQEHPGGPRRQTEGRHTLLLAFRPSVPDLARTALYGGPLPRRGRPDATAGRLASAGAGRTGQRAFALPVDGQGLPRRRRD